MTTATGRWVVFCANGKEHKLKTVTNRQKAREFVDYFKYIAKPKCGPHRVGRKS